MVSKQIPTQKSPALSSPLREAIRTAALVAAGGVVVGLVGLLSVAGVVGALLRRDAATAVAD
ncbi:MAG TPA: hypothetical protein VLA14_17230 [Polyangia bacterium]|jgi:hypothetical protein|nr:hypothetical protein [Polyangia bacterium]